MLKEDGMLKSKNGKNPEGQYTSDELELKYGDRTETYKRIPNKAISKDQLKPPCSSKCSKIIV